MNRANRPHQGTACANGSATPTASPGGMDKQACIAHLARAALASVAARAANERAGRGLETGPIRDFAALVLEDHGQNGARALAQSGKPATPPESGKDRA